MLTKLEEDRRGKWDVLMLSRELRSQYSSEVESRMPLQTARTGSERGVRATQQWATGPYSTTSQTKWLWTLLRCIQRWSPKAELLPHDQ